jgi:hypothetical protein
MGKALLGNSKDFELEEPPGKRRQALTKLQILRATTPQGTLATAWQAQQAKI